MGNTGKTLKNQLKRFPPFEGWLDTNVPNEEKMGGTEEKNGGKVGHTLSTSTL